jgi:hypothetical protein
MQNTALSQAPQGVAFPMEQMTGIMNKNSASPNFAYNPRFGLR